MLATRMGMDWSKPAKGPGSISGDRIPWSPETGWSEDLPFDYVDIKPRGEDELPRAHVVDTVLFGGLTAGLIDAVDAIVINRLGGVHATQVFQSVASGVLGSSAFAGGSVTAALGVALHFVIALSAAAIYLAASRNLPMLTRRPLVSGIAFGLGVWAFMNVVVLPLSAASANGVMATSVTRANDVLIHAFGFGLPISMFASRSAHRALK